MIKEELEQIRIDTLKISHLPRQSLQELINLITLRRESRDTCKNNDNGSLFSYFSSSCFTCTGGTENDNCCQCNTAAVVKSLGVDEDDVIFLSFHNKVRYQMEDTRLTRILISVHDRKVPSF